MSIIDTITSEMRKYRTLVEQGRLLSTIHRQYKDQSNNLAYTSITIGITSFITTNAKNTQRIIDILIEETTQEMAEQGHILVKLGLNKEAIHKISSEIK